jgi:ABC-type phosphate/phosphonate transport system permease subunit
MVLRILNPLARAFVERCPQTQKTMNWKILTRRTWLNLISVIILVVGLDIATLIYQRAGNVNRIMLEDSKMYRHNLEVFGGKFMVMIDDFRLWFLGLWHGKSLAIIIGCITLILSFGFFYAANHSSSHSKSEIDNDN